jgi:hypothetical protein
MSNFKGLSPRSSSDDPEKYKAGFVTYQGHVLYITWLISCWKYPTDTPSTEHWFTVQLESVAVKVNSSPLNPISLLLLVPIYVRAPTYTSVHPSSHERRLFGERRANLFNGTDRGSETNHLRWDTHAFEIPKWVVRSSSAQGEGPNLDPPTHKGA